MSNKSLRKLVIRICLAMTLSISCASAQPARFQSWNELRPHLNATPAASNQPNTPSQTAGGPEGQPPPLVRHTPPAVNQSESQAESQGRSTPPLKRHPRKPKPSLHSIEAFYAGDEMYWTISGANYSEVRLVLTGKQGMVQQTFTDLDSTRLSVTESGVPDGEYSYALVVTDPAYQRAVAEREAFRNDCIVSPDPYGGSQCYARPNSAANKRQSGLQEQDTPPEFNHTVFKSRVMISNGLVSGFPNTESE